MGFAVLHLSKASGNDAGMSAHIERTVIPKNADAKRTHLNRELVEFPEEVINRTQAIQHRLDTAGLKRKIGTNQVRAIRLMLTGTHKDMKRIEAEGKLNKWCGDNMAWLEKNFGKENIVSAVLHMDEKTPHIHATVVPIVKGERRKAGKAKKEEGKKQYRKKNPDTARLCADDVMSRKNLKGYQDSYAECMEKYGLKRGINGSEARHISTQQYYRELKKENDILEGCVKDLGKESEEVQEKIRYYYELRDEAREKYLNMDNYVREKEKEVKEIERNIEKLKQEEAPFRAQKQLVFLMEVLPDLSEQLWMGKVCEAIGFRKEIIIKLLSGGVVQVNGSLYSPEHKRYFEVQNAEVKIRRDTENPKKMQLKINGVNIILWFRQKFKELQQKLGVRPMQPSERKSKGFRL